MSKREPLLKNEMCPKAPPFHESEACEAFYAGLDWARDHYERLIDEGKLRVVEEVEWIDATAALLRCPKCDETHLKAYAQPKYCPGCGNKIKR